MINLEILNEKQREAVLYTEGALLILAGAGSGKTSTMTHRIAHLVEDEGVFPSRILAVTFTNKAAQEMRDRVESLLNGPINMWIMTFHATCLRMLRKHGQSLGYNANFLVYDPVDTKAVIKNIIKVMGIDEKQFTPALLLGKISKCKEDMISPEEYKKREGGGFREEVYYQVYRDYEKTLKKNNAMDFDDLLINGVKLLQKNSEILEEYQERFHYIMVDEYQDTNKVQYKLIKLLAGKRGNLCVVGDDDQCIYQWRGADITNILNFEKDFPRAKVIKLEQNYRSTENILNAAHSVIEKNKQRKNKKLWTKAEAGDKIIYFRGDDEKEEARYIAQEIDRLKRKNLLYKDFAILYRTNAQSRNFEEALSARDLPYRVVGGLRYYERKEIKDIVGYLRLVENPHDDLDFLRIINTPKRGIGASSQEKLRVLAEEKGESIFSCLLAGDVLGQFSSKIQTSLGNLLVTLAHYHGEKSNLRVSDIYDGILDKSGYLADLESKPTPENIGREENLMEFKSVIYDYEEKGELYLSDFLEKITLLSDVDNHDTTENAVVLMTMHSAKGLEFPYVFLPGMEDGLFPSWRSLEDLSKMEEERRLCYVGMTRAKKRLCLTSASYRTMYGKGNYTRESTFLRELNPKLMDGDGVYQKKKEVELGTGITFDGYAKKEPYQPFDGFAQSKRETMESHKPKEDFSQGDKVRHGKFGDGMVINISGNIAQVMFDSVGMKKLAIDVAPIQKVKGDE